uniref:Uncharacterized protein n=1 Tax=Oryza sativa subsp. japonica TaxID=39947 RepID=Q8LIS2_ORYSJ|nr:hypothetical protein [Oryza sativa Japonica Group]BAD31194.1 hypothetical protein [Oryza sativa Japonica Group]
MRARRRWLVVTAGSTELVSAAGSTIEAERRSLLCAGGVWFGMRAGEAESYRQREATAASTPIPVACGSAGGVPCVPAAGDADAVSSASLRAAAVNGECRRSIEDPSAGFSRANRRWKADGTILRPSVKGDDGGTSMRIWADSFGIGDHVSQRLV